MKLSYRGNAYYSENTQITTLATGETALFLGQTFLRRRPQLQIKSPSGLKKYRGIVYGS